MRWTHRWLLAGLRYVVILLAHAHDVAGEPGARCDAKSAATKKVPRPLAAASDGGAPVTRQSVQHAPRKSRHLCALPGPRAASFTRRPPFQGSRINPARSSTRMRELRNCRRRSAVVAAWRCCGWRARGKRWCTPLKLSCDSLDVQVGQTSVDFSALVTKQRVDLKRPAEGSATIKFTAEDWDNFLLHPGFKEIVTRRRRTDPTPPDFAFSRKGGTRMLPSAGSIAFPVRWDGATLMATLSQRADGRVECAATCNKAPEARRHGKEYQPGRGSLRPLRTSCLISTDASSASESCASSRVSCSCGARRVRAQLPVARHQFREW